MVTSIYLFLKVGPFIKLLLIIIGIQIMEYNIY